MNVLDMLVISGLFVILIGLPALLVLMGRSTPARSDSLPRPLPAYEREGHAARVRAARITPDA